MNLFACDDYREALRESIRARPKNGFGDLSRLAKKLGVSATLVSQVLAGSKNFTEEQAVEASRFFDFSEPETLFFLSLVQRERAGSRELRKIYQQQVERLREAGSGVEARVRTEIKLSMEEQAIYYSDWLFTAVHTLSSVKEFSNVDAIANHLKVSRKQVAEISAWLVEHKLCVLNGSNLTIGPRSTYVSRESLLVNRHHGNWRLKGLERMQERRPKDFFFTAPFSISVHDLEKIRAELTALASKVAKVVEKTEPARGAALTIDLFEI